MNICIRNAQCWGMPIGYIEWKLLLSSHCSLCWEWCCKLLQYIIPFLTFACYFGKWCFSMIANLMVWLITACWLHYMSVRIMKVIYIILLWSGYIMLPLINCSKQLSMWCHQHVDLLRLCLNHWCYCLQLPWREHSTASMLQANI